VGKDDYEMFSTGQLLGMASALAEKRESSFFEVLYLLMIDHMAGHADEFREAIWKYLLKSTDEIEEIVTNISTNKDGATDDFLSSLDQIQGVKIAEIEDIREATQRNLSMVLHSEAEKRGRDLR
jgi:hypothetical protein